MEAGRQFASLSEAIYSRTRICLRAVSYTSCAALPKHPPQKQTFSKPQSLFNLLSYRSSYLEPVEVLDLSHFISQTPVLTRISPLRQLENKIMNNQDEANTVEAVGQGSTQAGNSRNVQTRSSSLIYDAISSAIDTQGRPFTGGWQAGVSREERTGHIFNL